MGHLAQEYRYDEIQRTITPVSARFYPYTPSYFHSPSCSDDFTNNTQSAYDQDGNLWVGTNRGLAAGRMHIYFKDRETGKRRVETECSWLDPDTGDPRPSGFLCQSDLDVGRAFLTVWDDLEWGFEWAGGRVVDDVSGAVIVSIRNGRLGVVKPYETSAGGYVYAVTDNIDLGQDLLPKFPDEEILLSTKAIIDWTGGHIWLPVETSEKFDDCWLCDCVFPVGVIRNSWLYRVGLGAALNEGIQILGWVKTPQQEEDGRDVPVEFKATFKGRLHEHSALYVYHNGASTPDAKISWDVKKCSQGSCVYKAKVPGSVTKNRPGMLRWYGVIIGSNGSQSLLTAGRVEILGSAAACSVDADCDDGFFCNGAETCDAVSGCEPGSDPCPGQTCDEITDECVGVTDVVTIIKAEWNAAREELKVQATSSEQPGAVLTVVGFGQMTFKKNKYELKDRPVPYPGTVTVTSDLGGSGTATVRIR
jgi:hypothetical protein